MSALEQIVRPFAPPQPFNTQRLVATSVKQPTQTAHVNWGVAGTLPSAIETPALQPAAGIGFNTKKQDQRLTETSRETEKVKVQQEGNPDNFVVIERIKKITFGKTPDAPPEPTYLTKPDGGAAKTAPVIDLSGGDPNAIPVTKSGDTLFVDKRNLPAVGGQSYFQIKDRVYVFDNPPPGPNETLVP
jgi:hypothetical protein